MQNQTSIFFLFFIITLHLNLSHGYASDVVVVVNKTNPIDNISFQKLVKIFKQERQYWTAGKKIYLVLQEEGSSEKEIALKKIYKMNAIDLKKFWLAKIFREEISSFPQTLASNEAVKQFVSHVPNAISLINAAFVDESLKVLRINGKSFGEKGYALSEK